MPPGPFNPAFVLKVLDLPFGPFWELKPIPRLISILSMPNNAARIAENVVRDRAQYSMATRPVRDRLQDLAQEIHKLYLKLLYADTFGIENPYDRIKELKNDEDALCEKDKMTLMLWEKWCVRQSLTTTGVLVLLQLKMRERKCCCQNQFQFFKICLYKHTMGNHFRPLFSPIPFYSVLYMPILDERERSSSSFFSSSSFLLTSFQFVSSAVKLKERGLRGCAVVYHRRDLYSRRRDRVLLFSLH